MRKPFTTERKTHICENSPDDRLALTFCTAFVSHAYGTEVYSFIRYSSTGVPLAAAHARATLLTSRQSVRRKPLRVLVVDDNIGAAESIRAAIEDFGDVVQSCCNGPDAVSVARVFQPNVLFLDLAMPGMDGFEVANLLRKDRTFEGLKIIAQTGFNDDESRRRTANSGFDLCLSKPLSLNVLDDMLMMLRAAA